MSDQGKVQIKVGAPLSSGGVVTNVATNSADIKLMKEMAGNVTGKRIMPSEVNAKRGSFDEAMVVDGGSIMLGDGVVSARNLVRSQALIVDKAQIGNAIVDGDRLDLGPNGELSALSANLGTMTTGALQVGSGGVVIGDVAAGISIAANVIKAMKSGVPTVVIDGATGIITASKFVFTADSSSQVNLTNGTHQFSAGITIGGASDRTLGDMIRYFAQANDPGSVAGGSFTLRTGDIWTDTDDGNKIKRWNGSSWVTLQDSDIATALTRNKTYYQTTAPSEGSSGDLWYDSDDNILYRHSGASWVAQQIGTVNHTFAQTTQPGSGMTPGDLWVDTDDGNKIYRYNGSSWVSVLDAVNTGGYLGVDTNNCVTTIDLTGISVYTATSGQRVYISSAGIAGYNSSGVKTFELSNAGALTIQSATSGARQQITAATAYWYNSSGKLIVAIDASEGISVNNSTEPDPGATERLSIQYNTTEKGYLYAVSGLVGLKATTGVGIFLTPASGYAVDVYGNLLIQGYKMGFVVASNQYTIEAASAPSQGAASGLNSGCVRLGTGGSLWVVDGSGDWDRVRTYNYNP